MILIEKIDLPLPGLNELRQEASQEGFDFIDTLVDDWASAANRFNGPGEVLCGHLDQSCLVAVGGLTLDPYAGSPGIGRIRRIYVRQLWRRKGVGTALMAALLEHARANFPCVRLRAENANAARLYESLGFVAIASPDATHLLCFRRTDST